MRAVLCVFVIVLGAANVFASEGALPDLVTNTLKEIPEGFPRFEFEGHDAEAQLLRHFTWYHFSNRLANGPTLFNKEYLMFGDLWMGNAKDEKRGQLIQQVHRADLLHIKQDDEGYIDCHQHPSHAHDWGWPFPHWAQIAHTQLGPEGYTGGWHFNEEFPGWATVNNYMTAFDLSGHGGQAAIDAWELRDLQSNGIVENRWQLEATGPMPTILSPEGYTIDAFCAPWIQMRWNRSDRLETSPLPYIEWMREQDDAFSPERRVYIPPQPPTQQEHLTDCTHSLIRMYRHPKWEGKIKRFRVVLGPQRAQEQFEIDSIFTCFDTRKITNNSLFILACWEYFVWTGDVDFLRERLNPMRKALLFMQNEFGGLEHKLLRNPWVGHGGRPGYEVHPDGTKTFFPGRGLPNSYWDLLPFGGDDMFVSSEYHAALLAMAEAEEAVRAHPEWELPLGAISLEPESLVSHAKAVAETLNDRFWDADKGRYVGCVDIEGVAHDYGFTFVNLNAIWYGVTPNERAGDIMDWITGKRVIPGETSTGEDIYHWRFGPRATTLRNIDWYSFGWSEPEKIAWGDQVQDGGAVLGFSFYDLWARLHVLGPDNAWQRLVEILEWEHEVWNEGGYRSYYQSGKHDGSLQGGGTPGGLGIDFEFYESSLLPGIIAHGFLGLDAKPDRLVIAPLLPKACPRMALDKLQFQGHLLEIVAQDDAIDVTVHKSAPIEPLRLELAPGWTGPGARDDGLYVLDTPGVYRYTKE